MKKHTDTDIRAALKRKEQHRKPAEVPDDFLDNVLYAIEQDQKPKTVRLWRYVAVAASIALLVGIGAIIALREQPATPTAIEDVADIATMTSAREAQPIVTTNTDLPKAEPSKSEKQKQPAKKTKQTPPTTNEDKIPETTIAERPMHNTEIHYIAPSKMDEAIMKMAYNQNAERQIFECEADEGNTVQELVYVFNDDDKYDLIGRLILSASKFDTNTEGYFLNYSPQQFFFKIDDAKTGDNYFWIAENIGGGKIMLYAAHAPQNNELASDCYQSYLKKLTHNNMNTYTNN